MQYGFVPSVALLVLAPPAASGPGTLIGALEEMAPFLEQSETGSQPRPEPVVRLLFRRTASGWAPILPEEPAEPEAVERLLRAAPQSVHWTVCFDGKTRGLVDSAAPREWGSRSELADFGAHRPRSKNLPWVGSRTLDYAGWPQKPVHRPLLVTSAARCDDPVRWKSFVVTPALLSQLVPAFRAYAGAEAKDKSFSARDFRVVAAYQAVDRKIVTVVLTKKDLFGDRVAPEWVQQTLLVEPNGTIRSLGAGLRLVEAADLDGDGTSELLFRSAAYNRDGYVLFWDDFRHSIAFGWNYQ